MISYSQFKMNHPGLFFSHKNKKRDSSVTLERLKASNPRLYREIAELGRAEGVKTERERIRSLLSWNIGSQNRRMDSIIAGAVKKAIVSGEDNIAVIAEIKKERERVFALERWKERDAGKNEAIRSIVGEAVASGKTEEEVRPQLVVAFLKHNPKKDEKAAKLAGMTLEEYRKYSPKEN